MRSLNRLFALIFAASPFCFVGCDDAADVEAVADVPYRTFAAREIPAMNPPYEMRQKNWIRNGRGSCFHASAISVMRWQGQNELADYWRRTYGGGEYAENLCAKLDREQVRFAATLNGDVGFLEWCTRTRRGAAIPYFDSHAVTLVELNEREALLLDNNRTERYIRIPRDTFISNWRGRYGGCAITLVYAPPAPLLVADFDPFSPHGASLRRELHVSTSLRSRRGDARRRPDCVSVYGLSLAA